MPLSIIPQEIIDQYHLATIATKNGWVYLESRKGMYGLKQAKQHKAARGPTEYNKACLPGTMSGTMLHMDLGFFRGAPNLTEAVRDGANPSNITIIKSIEGSTSYRSIVDAVTRYLWVFPLKSKQPPIEELVDKFLSRYGSKHHSQRTILIDPSGQLARSQMFKHIICDRKGF